MDALLKAVSYVSHTSERRALDRYLPYGHPDTLWPHGKHCIGKWTNKPWQTDFHAAGKDNPERLLMAANGVGKTYPGGNEAAMHATGLYPDWWTGYRFDKPNRGWACTISNGKQKDLTQRALLGEDLEGNLGTGAIPGDLIIGQVKKRQCGVDGVADQVLVKHVSGGTSSIQFLVYEMGWGMFQGGEPAWIWLDEQPKPTEADTKIFTECQTRLIRTSGILFATFTPTQGASDVTDHFTDPQAPGIWCGGATWDDAPHLKEADKARLLASYPQHEIDARTKGIPMLGEGALFSVPESQFVIPPREFPPSFYHIAGCDFGIDHPAAGAWLAVDRSKSTSRYDHIWYLYDCYKKAGETPIYHAAQFRRRGQWIPIAWPHDGHKRESGGGGKLTEIRHQYAAAGANMLGKSARYYRGEDGKPGKGGAQPIEPIVMEIEERLRTGGLYVTNNCQPFLEEYRSLHRKNGQIVAKRDDIFKALCYAGMQARSAQRHGMVPRTGRHTPMQACLR